ncbi:MULTISPECIES: hypothetical protein [Sulfolobaceae]|nr:MULTISPECIES: hypothetical protein [unclassified Sulfolobus]
MTLGRGKSKRGFGIASPSQQISLSLKDSGVGKMAEDLSISLLID